MILYVIVKMDFLFVSSRIARIFFSFYVVRKGQAVKWNFNMKNLDFLLPIIIKLKIDTS